IDAHISQLLGSFFPHVHLASHFLFLFLLFETIEVSEYLYSSILVLDRIEAITGIRPVFYELDVCDKQALRKVFEQESIDAAIHFAGYKAVGESVQKPVQVLLRQYLVQAREQV
ncbi:GDP-mannose 4,6-dehydratase, partial [Burkholderia contaminans]|nr:GDP-mannose 4,6-dehydratase [Burkholderia contaminans]